jgi:hypothetical protein
LGLEIWGLGRLYRKMRPLCCLESDHGEGDAKGRTPSNLNPKHYTTVKGKPRGIFPAWGWGSGFRVRGWGFGDMDRGRVALA